MGARVYLIKGLGLELRRCDVTFSRTFAGGHLGNGAQMGATRIIWNTIYYFEGAEDKQWLEQTTSSQLTRNARESF